MRNTATIRYTVALVALMLGLAVSIRHSERGFLFEPNTSDALASEPVPDGQYDLQALTILNRVLLQLKDNYVEPDRIDPGRMLVHTLDRVQNTVPEVVALFNADMDASPTQVVIHVGAESETFDISEIESLWEMSFKLREIFRFVQEHIDAEEIDLRDVEYAAINGMLGTLDPHSVLLTPRIYADMLASNRGEFGGLGIVISIRDSQLTVISPMDDTPAGRAGFRPGDRIVKINDESTVNMPLDEAVNRLRGPAGTEVTIEVVRAGWTEPHAFTLRRENITIDSVSYQALGDGIGYVEIKNFQANTSRDLMDALAALEEEMGPMRGLILDLRNNPGGLLSQAIEVTDTFLSEGTIVTTVGIGDRLREENAATVEGTQADYPIAVLVNPGSASASEIVAGALKNHNRALIIGDTTFGKGSVQVLNEFADGSALKLTIAKYLTPGDVSIQGVGIVPDIRILPVTIEEEFINLYADDHVFREGDLNQALSDEEHVAEEQDRPSEVVKYYYEPEELDPEAIRDPDEFEMDFEIDFARQVVVAAGDATERNTMLARASNAIDRVREEQLAEVQERLRNRNVDWSAGANVIQPVTLSVEMSPAAGRVHVGDSISFTVTATNDGNRPLHQVRAVSRSDYGLFNDHEFVFGRIQPGESASWSVSVDVPVEEPTRYERVTFDSFADMIDLDSSVDSYIEIIGKARPHWGFSYFIDDAAGNGDGLLQVGETVNFVMMAANTGEGAAEETVMILRNQSEAAIFLTRGRESLDTLEPGETHRTSFEFEVRQRPENGEVTLEAVVYDAVFREFLTESLVIPVSEEIPTVQVRSGRATPRDGAVDILGGAADYTPAFARLAADGSLPVTGYATGFYRVEWDGGIGWVPEGAVDVRDPVAMPPSEVEPVIAFQPPSIALNMDTVQTTSDTFNLTGVITDDSMVRDYYVVIHNRIGEFRTQTLKVSYQYLGAASATIDDDIPLRLGTNQITVFARDGDQISASQVLYVYRGE